MNDPAYVMALDRAIKLSVDLEVAISAKTGCEPIQIILHEMQKDAAEALFGLISADAENPKIIRILQNRITRFTDSVEYLRAKIADGVMADDILTDSEREKIAELVLQPEDERMNDD